MFKHSGRAFMRRRATLSLFGNKRTFGTQISSRASSMNLPTRHESPLRSCTYANDLVNNSKLTDAFLDRHGSRDSQSA